MNDSSKFSVAALAALLIANEAAAMRWYSPNTGRWLSRDTIAEAGGINLYAFVRNNSVQHVDKLGMFVSGDPNDAWNIFIAICPICNGRRYNILTSCCCKGKIVAKTPIETGIVTHKWTGPPGVGPTPVHYWITWDGGSADANSYALLMQPGDGKVSSPAGATPTPNTPIPLQLSPCEYDFKKLNACMTRLAGELKTSQKWWWCSDLPPYMIKTCKEESKGCTVAP